MNAKHNPGKATVVMGLVLALWALPLNILGGLILTAATATQSTLWFCLLAYAGFLGRRTGRGFGALLFPLLIPLILIAAGYPTPPVLMISLGILSWIRSGICFPSSPARKFAAEILLCGGGGILSAVFVPPSVTGLPMGIWLFFLVQSVYFLIFDEFPASGAAGRQADPFDRARRHAERILSDG